MNADKARVIEEIRAAFQGVVLGNGVGLFEGDAIDDYADEATRLTSRERDEKINWETIPQENLNVCYSSLSYFDAEGMRFHLPAFLVADLKGELGVDPVFHLTQTVEYDASKMALLSPAQRHAVRGYLEIIINDPRHDFDRPHIERAINAYWSENLAE